MKRPQLLFDIMSTVVYDPIFAEIPGFFGLTLAEFFAAATPQAWIDFELGTVDEKDTMASFFRDKRRFDAEQFKSTIRDAYRFIDDGMEPLLQELNAQGYAIHALSNYPPWFWMIEEKLELSRYLKWSFVSCELGLRKPDPAIYLAASERLAIPPSDALFVDDREDNCEGARSVGMDAIRFESSDKLRTELRNRRLI
ncbi:MAG: HAD family phosphatase [Myxococcota bacterium]